MAARPEPPVCPRCGERPRWHFSAIARRADAFDPEPNEVLAEVVCAVCFDGTWVWRGAWSSPWER